MYVLCTLLLLSIRSLLKRPHALELHNTELAEHDQNFNKEIFLAQRGKRNRRIRIGLRSRRGLCSLVQPEKAQYRSKRDQHYALHGPAVMFGTRKTWDLGHAPCLQELWSADLSLDASSVDLLISDGEEENSFLTLPNSVRQRRRLTFDLGEPALSDPQLLIQALQEKVSEIQACLYTEDPTNRPLLPQITTQQVSRDHQNQTGSHQDHRDPDQEPLQQQSQRSQAVKRLSTGSQLPQDHCVSVPERKAHPQPSVEGYQLTLISGLHAQIEELEKKLLDRTQEVERLRSELGATDLEKQLELLESENQRLRQELKATSYSHESLSQTCPSNCPHSQEASDLQGALSRCEDRRRECERRVSELQQQLLDRVRTAEQLQEQLAEALRSKAQSEEQLRRTEEALQHRTAAPPQATYVIKSAAADSSQLKEALMDAQAHNEALEEQLAVQRQLLQKLEQQLHDSQRANNDLHKKMLVREAEMERTRGQLEAEIQNLEVEKNRVIEEAFIRAESEMKAVHENLAGVRMNLLTLQPALRTLTCDYNCLKRQVQDFPFMLEKAISDAKQEICHMIEKVSSVNQELLRKYKREMNLRKKCHNELVRLKGNIRVFCRVRPIFHDEAETDRNVVTFDPDDDCMLYLSSKGKLMVFEMDKVFPPQAKQEEVFQEVRSLITSCIDGYNVCIFAYGQTGSGKTYTMEGVPENPGINQRALRLLFSEVSEKEHDWNYTITVSMVEIYNETLRNLLGDNTNEKLDIKMCPDGSGQLYVPGLTEFAVESVEDINKVFEVGHMNRATACTNLNEHSSRSHALLIITVAGVNTSTGQRTTGKLNLVDLAGSERISKSGAEGCRLREAQCINKSLSALGDVINSLRSRHSHVPFRNSRLTYLLQDSLSGDSKTLMLVQISPLDSNMIESVCSLKFAQRVRTVELGMPSSSRRLAENSSASSSPTHDGVELDSPPVTPVSLTISRASSMGSSLSSSLSSLSTSRSSSTRRRSQSQQAAERQLGRSSPLVVDSGQDDRN